MDDENIKITGLINKLQECLNAYGDIEVFVSNDAEMVLYTIKDISIEQHEYKDGKFMVEIIT